MKGKNNPLNIRTSAAFTWNGQTGSHQGFCDFEDVSMCRRAGLYLLMRSYRRAGVKTLGDIIKRWAPAFENPTGAYITYVSNRTGLQPTMQLYFDSDYAAILAAMEIFEQGVPVSKRAEYYETTRKSYEYLISYFKIKQS